ncbi:JlpA family lipoprotein adhesin [Campylobacter taeniopygiae]|uniref:JlpA family lipoprotein adhesin n=1 Tax=Campylobacter taeniopygiae TaxID=2510188 RepID=UPI003D6C4B5D
MKKNLALGVSLVFFVACSNNSLDQSIVKKYENALNTQIKEEQNSSKEFFKFNDFKCQNDGSFIKCMSPNLEVFNPENHKKIFGIENVEYKFNGIYTGDKKGPISFRELLNFLFSKNEKLQDEITFKNLKLSDEAISELDKINLNRNQKINDYLKELISNPFTISFKNLNTKKNDENNNYLSNINIQSNDQLNLNLSANIDYKLKLLDMLDSYGFKYDIDSISIKNVDENNTNKIDPDSTLSQILENITIHDTKLTFSLDTKEIFKDYIEMANSMLKIAKENSKDEKQTLVIDKALKALEKITQNPTYKLDIEVFFKDIPLNTYSKEKEKAIEKLTINGEDFTEVVSILGDSYVPLY